jgi:shikimate dehydrogenase
MLKLVLLGSPIAHSLSPQLHTAALEAAGIEGIYQARRVDADGMAEAVAELRSGRLDGANVTMPHKRLAAALADEVSAEAARAGSANTLSVHNAVVRADTSDVEGIRRAWGSLPAERVLILGSGGAAAAALLALEGHELFMSARRPETLTGVAERTGVAVAQIEWGTAMPGAVVVNATPLGMQGERLPAGVVEESAGLFDMVYGAGQTAAVETARSVGIPAVTGLDMLIAQAEISFAIWTGVPAPPGTMRAAAER